MNFIHATSALTLLALTAALPRAARAGEETPPPAAAPAEWQARYAEARKLMFDGVFTAAATRFAELAESAPDPGSRRLASEQEDICRRWAQGGFVLRPRFDDAAARYFDRKASAPPIDRRTTDELAVLYTTAVLYGVGSGMVLAAHTEPESNAGLILPILGFSAASAGLVAAIDAKWGLRYGVAQSIVSGMFIGLEEAMAWTIWHQAAAHYEDEWKDETLSTIFWATASAGAVAGGIYGTLHGTTPGRASLMGSAALWTAAVAGLAAGSIARDESKSDDYAMLTAALALNAGAVGGVVLGQKFSPSIARVRFLDLGGLAGGLLFGGLYLAMGDRNENNGRTLMGVAATGIAAGVGSAWYFTRDMETDQARNRAAPANLATLTPILAPAADGRGMLFGLGGTL